MDLVVMDDLRQMGQSCCDIFHTTLFPPMSFRWKVGNQAWMVGVTGFKDKHSSRLNMALPAGTHVGMEIGREGMFEVQG